MLIELSVIFVDCR